MSFDLAEYLARQQAWGRQTFGPGARTKGVVAHIRKELEEIEADPTDVYEWIDVVILAFDGALRSGTLPDEIVYALETKQQRNMARTWPDWRGRSEDEPIEHDRTEEAA